jgi:hypothetical protein
MRRISIKFLATSFLTLAFCAAALAGPAISPSKASFTIAGRVLKVDQKARTMLVADYKSEKLYQVSVPEGATFKITFGRYMHLSEPRLDDVVKNDRISARCTRSTGDHLAGVEAPATIPVVIATR